MIGRVLLSTRTRRARSGHALCLAIVAATLAAFPVSGQQIPDPVPAPRSTAPEIPPVLPISPGGAFLRAALVPGWGHAAIGSYVRGGFYASVQGATVYSFLRNRARLSDARRSRALREAVVRRNLATQGITVPDDVDSALNGDQAFVELQLLVESREAQREDLLAFGIFLVLLSSADAYVSAHLARFPDPLELEANPTPQGGVEVGLRILLPN